MKREETPPRYTQATHEIPAKRLQTPNFARPSSSLRTVTPPPPPPQPKAAQHM
ncbi:hypothetical protein BU24DRAFT_418173 [Aaosphaeria arxii CBS 175.79]|uniref:Uncharacterized protein n=1 Tax=Aaosphaeria arxii CBS 175.79 TaxID=1450172 RepID=A0A6A5Y0E2_9PLEO|nr:uncharacterized protein BU24DRAFT_418173 [Aaosphaeria arxii CBS 175.79]KAF2018653.1 hypothetical protein BU24DRAFT_418173 [Aaosphaeria arxii CBS 175.79]